MENKKLKDDVMEDNVSFSSDEEEEEWTDKLQQIRLLVAQRVRFSRIAASLMSNEVIDQEDKEELESPFINTTETQRINRLIDMLTRKGEDNYVKFLQILGVYYADVYKEITGTDPDVSSFKINISVDEFSTSDGDLVHYLMQALEAIKGENQVLKKENGKTSKLLECEREEQQRIAKRMERYELIEEELKSSRQEVDRLQHENYTVCMRVLETKDEIAKLRDHNIKLLYDSDRKKAELQKIENCFEMERTQSVRLRRRLQQGPTEREFMELRKQVDILTLKLTQADQCKTTYDRDKELSELEKVKEDTVALYAKALEDLNKKREECAKLNAKCSEYLEEKEQLELTCASLRSDSTMFKMRRDSVWQQLQEVEKEREMIMEERNEAQTLARSCMQEKANYRTQLRDIEARYDDLKEILLRTEKKLAHEIKLNSLSQQPSTAPPVMVTSPICSPKIITEKFRPRANNVKDCQPDVVCGREKSDSIVKLTEKFDNEPTTTATVKAGKESGRRGGKEEDKKVDDDEEQVKDEKEERSAASNDDGFAAIDKQPQSPHPIKRREAQKR